MVETGTYFSTGGGHSEGADGETESPGTLKRGLRSTSYRRAVVSGVDMEVPSVDANRLSQSVIRWLDEDRTDSPFSPASPGATSHQSPGTAEPASPGTPKLAVHKVSKPAGPGSEKPTSTGINKVGGLKK